MRQQFLIKRSPIRANPHGFIVLDGHFDNRRELLVTLVLKADIAGIDPVFIKRLGAGWMIG